MSRTLFALLSAMLLIASGSARAADQIWRCVDPERPWQLAETGAEKNPNTCDAWVQVRGGDNLHELLSSFEDLTFPTANDFAYQAARLLGLTYPVVGSFPATTSDVYATPRAYNIRLTSLDEATAGSIVVYDGLAGVLVESRASESDGWKQQVIYPSARNDFRLVFASPIIPGKQAPMAIVEPPPAPEM